MKRRTLFAAAAATMSLALGLSACGGNGAAGGGGGEDGDNTPVTLTFVTGFPEKLENNDGFWMFRDKLAEKAPWVTIEYRGGPEVIAPTQLIESVSSGAIDGAHLPGDYYTGQLPAMEIQRFTPFSPQQERENGLVELWQEVHEPIGVHLVGRTHSGIPQVIMLKDRIDTPDLTGKSVRVSSTTSNMVRALGGTPVEMPGSEVYTALERGVVQGTTWTSVGVTGLGLEKQAKYYMVPRFYDSVANTVINQDTWDGLEPATQEAITEAMAEAEPAIFEHYQALQADETQKWLDAGVERLEFNDEDTQRMLKIAYIDAWDTLDWNRITSDSPAALQIRERFEAEYGGDLKEVVPGGIDIKGTSEQ
ncbi:TRAP transporter substrate-binding protein DctP [Granulicoccus sp. GXG6511]|uniref:TRAP transporter substrate-binding protein DctP n=1 Tax=Granulicoccus sp. GXG6511 TaxID=3381351 RepID=UPI003D7E639C